MRDEEARASFIARLRRAQRQRRGGLLLHAGLRVLTWVAWLTLACGLLDLWLAPGTTVRLVTGVSLVVLLLGLALAWASTARRFSLHATARLADAALASRRRDVLGALDLLEVAEDAPATGRDTANPPEAGRASRAPEGQSRPLGAGGPSCSPAGLPPYPTPPLRQFLIDRAVAAAGTRLAELRFRAVFPFAELRWQTRALLLPLLALALAFVARPGIAGTVAERVFCPWRDLPPYSPYTFTIDPPAPRVLYDGTLEVRLTLTGAPARGPVWLRTRHAGWTQRTACFQEGAGRYAQRLERVTVPLEFCFAVGKARSSWQRVEVLLQPQIALAELTLTPPAYSRLAVRRFAVGADELAGLAETGVLLEVTSNRPLLDGTVVVRPEGTPDETVLASGTRAGPRALSFAWTLAQSGTVEVRVRDPQGTACRQPLVLRQRLIPDAPPEVVLSEPGEHVLATPTVVVPLTGRATDDLGLFRVEWVRTVVGYRDRATLIGPETPNRTLDLHDSLDLGALGVESGEVLEVYAEARDSNPALTGVGASSVCRIQVISTEEYAALVRARTTLDQFRGKFHEVATRLQSARDALERLQEAAKADPADPARAAALAVAWQAAQDAAAALTALAADFPAFDLETRLAPELERLAGVLQRQAERLGQTAAESPDLAALAGQLQRELGAAGAGLKPLTLAAETAARVAEVMACASRFREVVRRQGEIAGRLRRYGSLERVPDSDAGALAMLAQQQRENRENLLGLVADLRQHAAELPEGFASLATSVTEFVAKLEALGVPALMEQAVQAAEARDGATAHRAAQLALERLEQLLSECQGNGFGDLCQGHLTFSVPKDIQATLAQLLSALAMQTGQGSGTGMGEMGSAGWGGLSQGGAMAGAQSLLNVPAYGPPRLASSATAGGGSGQGRDRPGSAMARVSVTEPEATASGQPARPRGQVLPMEQVPPKYAAAVKRYFSSGP